MNINTELRPFWRKYFGFHWKFGLLLVLFICIPRFFIVLHANAFGNYSLTGVIMIVSALVPFIFLGKKGRRIIGITKPKKPVWLIFTFTSGLIASFLLYLLGKELFGDTISNWYTYIGRSYHIPPGINEKDKTILFIISAITGMIFSPVGEELFFRGIVQTSFSKTLGENKATIFSSLAFALTHISHFGLVYSNDHWEFLPIPTIIWVSAIFLVGIVFFVFKKRHNSLLGAMLCHSAFNLGMIYSIFYLL